LLDFSTVHKILRRKLVKRMTVTVQRIVDLTERYGTSGAFIARLCGKSRSLIAGWKDGKAAPTDSDLVAIADLYGVSVAYLRGEVDVPESSVKNALQQQLLESVKSLTDDEMLKVIEYVRFLKFLDEEQKAGPQ
jgi:transcriptional regulator with XRE-family HTH domain